MMGGMIWSGRCNSDTGVWIGDMDRCEQVLDRQVGR